MSIKDRQIASVTEDAIKRALLSGQSPDFNTVQSALSSAFAKHPAGTPSLAFTPIAPDSLSDPAAFNSMLDQISSDLSVAFDEVSGDVDDLIAMEENYDTAINHLYLQMQDIEARVNKLQSNLSGKSSTVFTDSFKDFSQVDFVGDSVRGVPATTAFVDLKHAQVTLPDLNNSAMKFDLSGTTYTVSVSTGSGAGSENFPFVNALNDNINDVWEYVVQDTVSEETAVTIDLKFNQTIAFSTIGLRLLSPNQTNVTICLSSDGTNYQALKETITAHQAQWQVTEFQLTSPIQYMRIILDKSVPDYNDGVNFWYYFGIQSLSITKETYQNIGYFTSLPFASPTPISAVTLQTEDVVLPGTSIRYYVSLDNDGELMNWQHMNTGDTIDYRGMTQDIEAITSLSLDYGQLYDAFYGVNYHELITLITKAVPNTTTLRLGTYMWRVDSQDMTGLATPLPTDYTPSLSDWTNPQNLSTGFIPIENTQGGQTYALTAGHLQMFRTYVYCASTSSQYNVNFQIGSGQVSAYLNNQLLNPVVNGGVYTYSYNFQAGWNELKFLTYTDATATFAPNLYLKNISTSIYAAKDPLIETDLYRFTNNTAKTDLTRFAYDGNKLIVNYDPVAMDLTGTGIRYDLTYSYAENDVSQNTKIRLMAVLSLDGTSDQNTPVLKDYHLIIE